MELSACNGRSRGMRYFALLVLSLGLSSCGWSETLAACGSDVEPPGAAATSDLVALSFEQESYPPGANATFAWEIGEEVDLFTVMTGDEWIVECWYGTSWNSAWMAMAVYDNEPFPRSLDEEFSITSDGYDLMDGVVAIPKDTPPGWYRVTNRPRADIVVEARFVVEAGD